MDSVDGIGEAGHVAALDDYRPKIKHPEAQILIVDDDPDIGEPMAEILGMALDLSPERILVLQDPVEALVEIGEGIRGTRAAFAVYLLDMDLKHQLFDGLTIANLAMHGAGGEVAMVTSYADDPRALIHRAGTPRAGRFDTKRDVEGFDLGPATFIAKPADPQQAIDFVRRVMRKRGIAVH